MQLRRCVGWDVSYFEGCDFDFFILRLPIESAPKLWHTVPLYGFSPNLDPASHVGKIHSSIHVRPGTTSVYVYIT